MNTRAAEQIADAVLYEGYVLYPYRASAPKNRMRWQVGLVTPRTFAEAVGSDPWFTQTECLAEIGQAASLTLRVRCLHVQERTVQAPSGGGRGDWHTVDRLVVDDRPLVPWDEAVAIESSREGLRLTPGAAEWCWAWSLPEATSTEVVHDAGGAAAGRLVRRRRPLEATVRVVTETCGPVLKLRVRVENMSSCSARTLSERDEALRSSLVGTHAILGLEDGAFVSLLDPPEQLSELAASCVNTHTFPVLAGAAGSRGIMLSSPIILYDFPSIAPESRGDLCDGTEIDELLTLRVRTLTDDEKREARATDDRAAQIVDRCDAASPSDIAQLHGALRSFEAFLNPPDEPLPEEASIQLGGVHVRRGSSVRLQPARVTDSLDICVTGRTATVTAVYRTLEGQPYIAVALDDDPYAAEGAKYRRSLFFHPDELVPLAAGE